jgi:transmembrane sensor
LRGQQSDVVLPDGSRIRLDTATRLDVTLYRQRREVRLIEGQAVFQVERDAGRRFDVMAGPVTVTVVGTRFSVRKVPGATGLHGVRVAVEEGRVRVAGPPHGGADGSGETVELQAGQQVAVRAGGRLEPVQPLAPGGMAPWREGRINFDNVPLGEALAEFERYGRTGLVVRDDKVAQMRLTGTFDPARLANFKLALPKVLPVRLRGDAGSTEIVAVP